MHTTHVSFFFFFVNSPAPTEIYTLSLHDALPICETPPQQRLDEVLADLLARLARGEVVNRDQFIAEHASVQQELRRKPADRKSTRLNSSHVAISYAVFCLKKKKTKKNT